MKIIRVIAIVLLTLFVIKGVFSSDEIHLSMDRNYELEKKKLWMAISSFDKWDTVHSGIERIEILNDTDGVPIYLKKNLLKGNYIEYDIALFEPYNKMILISKANSLDMKVDIRYEILESETVNILRISMNGKINSFFQKMFISIFSHKKLIDREFNMIDEVLEL